MRWNWAESEHDELGSRGTGSTGTRDTLRKSQHASLTGPCSSPDGSFRRHERGGSTRWRRKKSQRRQPRLRLMVELLTVITWQKGSSCSRFGRRWSCLPEPPSGRGRPVGRVEKLRWQRCSNKNDIQSSSIVAGAVDVKPELSPALPAAEDRD